MFLIFVSLILFWFDSVHVVGDLTFELFGNMIKI